MDNYLKQLTELINITSGKKWFLDLLFGDLKYEALKATPVVLFGAGELGEQLFVTLKYYGITPDFFCDNDASKSGQLYCGIPIISFDELITSHQNSLIVIATQKYLEAVTNQLLKNGFRTDRVFCKEFDNGSRLVFVYSAVIFRALTDYNRINLINKFASNYQKTLMKLKDKTKIKVAFFIHSSSIWKYDYIYRMMACDDRFEPIIVICPYINTKYSEDDMIRDMEDTFIYFRKLNYVAINTYEKNKGEWLDVLEEVHPDIVFFSNPYELHNKAEHYITHYFECLTCYVPYSFTIPHVHSFNYNELFHNLLWKAFYETPIHKDLATRYAQNYGSNVIVTGYPGTDIFIDRNYCPKDAWKIKDRNIKRIIWAPHHTIHPIDRDECLLGYSNFMHYHQFMLDIAEKYSKEIQIAFKPHPILKKKLYLEGNWGRKKTDSYYLKWKNLINGQLEESEYYDLFLTSDAMIHDSGSFMTEYLYLGKPPLFTVKDKDIRDRFNIFGKMVFEHLYHAYNEIDIIAFIEDVVIHGNDPQKEMRIKFYNDYLVPPNNKSASENIFYFIKEQTHASKGAQ